LGESDEEINDSDGNGTVHKARMSIAQKRRCRAKKLKIGRQASARLELRELDAIRGYEAFHQLPVGSATLQQVTLSSAGIEGFADYAKSLDVVSADVNSDCESDCNDDECDPPHGIVDSDSDDEDLPDIAIAIAKQKSQRKWRIASKVLLEAPQVQDHQELRHKLLERLGVLDEVKKEVKNKNRRVTFAVGDMKLTPGIAGYVDGAHAFPILQPTSQLQLFEREDPPGCDSQIMSNELWQDVEFDVALDSGSQDHVCDEVDCPGYATEPSPGSSRGQCFIVGNGGRLDNMGQRRLNMQPLENDAQQISSVFQIAKVTRPLMSVGKICDNGMRVTFDEKKAVVSDSNGAEICVFERKPGGLYIAKFRLKAPSPGFTRQG
jgi:hypothetical protein